MAAKPAQPGVPAFDYDAYWRANGPYLAGPGPVSPEHRLIEGILAASLPDLEPITDVLDVGCGRGRIAALLKDVLPQAAYAGMDIGDAQVAATRKVRPDGELYLARLQDFEPGRQWDLVIVSEVLMHIPPADIAAVCDKVKGLARRWLVTIDWTVPMDGPIAEWNWLYPYESLLGPVERVIPVGLQSIFFVRR